MRKVIIISFILFGSCHDNTFYSHYALQNTMDKELNEFLIIITYTKTPKIDKKYVAQIICKIENTNDTVRILNKNGNMLIEKNEYIFFHNEPFECQDSVWIPFDKNTFKYINCKFPTYYGNIVSLED